MPQSVTPADASPLELAIARRLHDEIVAALDPLDAPLVVGVLRLLRHSLADRYPAYADAAGLGPAKPIPNAAATAPTTES